MAAGAVRTAARIAQRPSFEGPVSSPATEQDSALYANSVTSGIRSARGNRAGVVPAELRQAPAANSGTSQTLDPVMAHNVVQGLLSEILDELKAQRSATDLITNSPALSKLADGTAMGTQELRDAAEQLRTASADKPKPAPVPATDRTDSAAMESGTSKASDKDTARVADAVEKMDARDAQAAEEAASERERQRQRDARLEAREERWRQQDKRDEERAEDTTEAGEEKTGFLKKLVTGDFAGIRGDMLGAALSTVGLEDFAEQFDEVIQKQAEKDGGATGERKPSFLDRMMRGSVADRLASAGASDEDALPQLPGPESPRRTPADADFGTTLPSFGENSQVGADTVVNALPSSGGLSSAMALPTLAGGLEESDQTSGLFERRDRREPATATGPDFSNLGNLTLSADRIVVEGVGQPTSPAPVRPVMSRAPMLPAPTGRRGLASNGAPLRPALGGPARRVGMYGAIARKPRPTGDKARDRINKIEFFVIKQEQKVLRRLMKTLERVENALPKGGLLGRLLGRTKLGRLLGYGDALDSFGGWGSDRGRGRDNRRPGTRGGRMRQFMGNAMKGLRGIIGGTVAAVSGAASRVGGALGMGGGRGGPARPRGRGIGGRIAGAFGRGARAATAVGGSLLGMSVLDGMFGGGIPDTPQPTTLSPTAPGTKPTMVGRAKEATGRLAGRASAAAPGVASKVGAATAMGSNLVSRATSAAPGVTSAAKTAGKAAGGVAGAVGRGALKAAKFIPIAGQALTAGMAVYDGFKGWGRAGQNFGLEQGKEATMGQKISSSVGGILSGLSFGLLDEGSIARGVHGVGSGIGSVASKVMEYSPLGLAAKGFKALFGDEDEDQKKGSDVVKGASVRSTGHIGEGVGLIPEGEGKSGKASATTSIIDKAKSVAALTPVGFMAKTVSDLATGDGGQKGAGSTASVGGAALGSSGVIAGVTALSASGADREFSSTGNPVMDRRVQRARARMEEMKARRDKLVASGEGEVKTSSQTTTGAGGVSGTETTTIRTTGYIGPTLDLSADKAPGSALVAKALSAGMPGTADKVRGAKGAVESAGATLGGIGKTALESTPFGMVAAQAAKALGVELNPKALAERAKSAVGGAVGTARDALGAAAGPAGTLMSKLSSFSPLAMIPSVASKLFGGDDAPEGTGKAVSGSVRSTGAFFGDMVPGTNGKAQPGRTFDARTTSLGSSQGTASGKAAASGGAFDNILRVTQAANRAAGLSGVVQSAIPDLSSFFSSDKSVGSLGTLARGASVTSSHTLDTDVKLPPAIQDQVLQNDTVLSKVASSMTGRGSMATAANPMTARPGETASAKRAFKARPSRAPAGGRNGTRGSGASSFHVDDYGIAVMNSILFD